MSDFDNLSTAAEVLREARTCTNCGSTVTVDIVRTEQLTDYEDRWSCPICQTVHSEYVDGDTDIDEVDPDTWHDAMREED